MDSKTCIRCQTEKPLAAFARCAAKADGLQMWCRECQAAYVKNRIATNPEARRRAWDRSNERQKRLYATDEAFREKRKKAAADWKKRVGPEVVAAVDRNCRLKREYGITQADFNRMVLEQGHRCACCGKKKAKLIVDHDHETGRVRGLVCYSCNVGIGLLGDTHEHIDRAIAYLTGQRQYQPFTFVG